MINISIIIPVFNDELHISDCLSSILEKQNALDIEVICVNDGSTDRSEEILAQYAEKYKNLYVFKQEHRGLSNARNNGLLKARGKYVYFVDSDDIVADDMLSQAFLICEEKNLDVLFFSFESFGDNPAICEKYAKHINGPKRIHNYDENVISGKKMHDIFWKNNEYYPMVWLQLVRRDFLSNNRISFDDGMIYEDNLYTFKVLYHAERTMCKNEVWYYKRIREDSITTNPESVHSVFSFLHTYLSMINYIYPVKNVQETFKAINKISSLQLSYGLMLKDIYKTTVRRYLRLSESQRKELYEVCDLYEMAVLSILCKKVSVIVPVYNTENFVGDCIRSIQAQTVQNLEIIIVDDGSTDRSADIIHNMMLEDDRIKYFYQKNSGSGTARNLGMSNASGDYISFLDSDDYYFENDALQKMLIACECNDVQICGSYRIENKNGTYIPTNFLRQWGDISQEGIVVEFIDYQNDFFYQSYIYRRNLIIDNNLSFPTYRRYQDPPFLLKAMDIAKKFCVIPVILHCYRKGHQNYAGNGRFIFHILQGIKDNLTLADQKYELIFDDTIRRIDYMFLQDIQKYWSDDVERLLLEINDIYTRHYPGQGDMKILTKLKCSERTEGNKC